MLYTQTKLFTSNKNQVARLAKPFVLSVSIGVVYILIIGNTRIITQAWSLL